MARHMTDGVASTAGVEEGGTTAELRANFMVDETVGAFAGVLFFPRNSFLVYLFRLLGEYAPRGTAKSGTSQGCHVVAGRPKSEKRGFGGGWTIVSWAWLGVCKGKWSPKEEAEERTKTSGYNSSEKKSMMMKKGGYDSIPSLRFRDLTRECNVQQHAGE
jgi:hypothetical protein